MTPSAPAPFLRRYLASFAVERVAHRFTDILVLGSGVSGLSSALAAASSADVLVVSKAPFQETATRYAQGGVAAVLEPETTGDSLQSHIDDTLRAAGGLANEDAVRLTITEGVECVRQLTEYGAQWDLTPEGQVHFTLEGGHSRPRILHRGDTTGQEIERVLAEAANAAPRISALENTYAVDLLTADGAVRGAVVMRPHGELEAVWAKRTILATGGLGRLFRETTNPSVATGDGIALAFRAGATLQDLEFVQFHPTTLYLAGADRFLVTEAVRGEGGVLIDTAGKRFMPDYHELADLAPRDVVSRAIVKVMRESGDNKVFLDLSPIARERILKRFPRIREKLSGFGIDILGEPIPVRPSAHYSIGGVSTDFDGRTTVAGLFAAGEVAATGLHGANRLASNSLLEGLVFGRRAGAAAAAEAQADAIPTPFSLEAQDTEEVRTPPLDLDDLRTSLQSLLWQDVGLERSGDGLASALDQIDAWVSYALPRTFDDAAGWGLQNMLVVARLMALSALMRKESRGVHYRLDCPERDDANWQRHIELSRDDFA